MSAQTFTYNGLSKPNSDVMNACQGALNDFDNQYAMMNPWSNHLEGSKTTDYSYNIPTQRELDNSMPTNKMNEPSISPQTLLNEDKWLKAAEREAGNAPYSKPFCELCQKVFCNIYYLKRHIVHYHRIYDTLKTTNMGLETFCIICYKQFENKTAFVDHFMQQHSYNKLQRKRKINSTIIDPSLKRSKTEGQRANPVHHTEIGSRKYNGERNCDLCPNVFGSVYALKKHKINQHLVSYDLESGKEMVRPPKHFYPDRNSLRLIDSLIENSSKNKPGERRKNMIMRQKKKFPSFSSMTTSSISNNIKHQDVDKSYFKQNSSSLLPELPELIPISENDSRFNKIEDANNGLQKDNQTNNENFCSSCNLQFSSRFFLDMHKEYKHGRGYNHSAEVESVSVNSLYRSIFLMHDFIYFSFCLHYVFIFTSFHFR